MWQRVYQAVLVSCSVGIAWNLPTLAHSLRRDFWLGNGLPLIDIAAFIGLGLLPVAAVGLWNLRLWGFVILMTGMFIVAGAATFHLGVVHGLEWTLFHFACFFATVLLYFGLLRRRPDDSSRWAELCIHCDGSGTCKKLRRYRGVAANRSTIRSTDAVPGTVRKLQRNRQVFGVPSRFAGNYNRRSNELANGS